MVGSLQNVFTLISLQSPLHSLLSPNWLALPLRTSQNAKITNTSASVSPVCPRVYLYSKNYQQAHSPTRARRKKKHRLQTGWIRHLTLCKGATTNHVYRDFTQKDAFSSYYHQIEISLFTRGNSKRLSDL